MGPCKYFDFGFCFFLISIPEFNQKSEVDPSKRNVGKALRTSNIRHIFPFLLNLNLNPLYSRRGGSTTRTDPFINPPISALWRKEPL